MGGSAKIHASADFNPPNPCPESQCALLRSRLAGPHSWFGLRPPNIREVPSQFISDEKYSNKKKPKLPKTRT